MKNSSFGNSCLFTQVVISIFFGVMTSSCATHLNIPAITTESQNTLSQMDEADRPYFSSIGDRSLQPEDITEGVITDYITLIDFLVARNEFRAKTLAPTLPLFSDTGITYPHVIFYYKGRFKIDQTPGQPEYISENCSEECAKILFEGHAESVLSVKIDAHSFEVIPSSIREFRKTDDCFQSYIKPTYYRELPALGLCIEILTPKNGIELLEEDGLHVYGDRHHLISPLAPKEFWVDSSQHLPNPGILAIAYHRPVSVMKNLEHVTVRSDNDTQHRAIGIRTNGRPVDYYMLYDYTCLSIEPELPESIVRKLITKRAGKNVLNSTQWDGDKLYYEEEGPLCQGNEPDSSDSQDLFSDWQIDFPSIFSPQEIEDRLIATLRIAKTKGDSAEEWGALGSALASLRRWHPEFDTEIAHRIAPILIETAKRRLNYPSDGAYLVLRFMPHKSMEPYVNDLIGIIENPLRALRCEEPKCPENVLAGKLSSLAVILNGAGPNAAQYLDHIDQTNKDMRERFGANATRIGGIIEANACIRDIATCPR